MDVQGLLDAYQEGWASTNPALREQRAKEKRDQSAEERKLKLANELHMQLLEKQAQLAQQYPKYIQFQKTPYGVIGLSENGRTDMVYKYTPDELKEIQEDKDAVIQERKSKADLNQANVDYLRSGAKAQEAQARAAALLAAAGASNARKGLLDARTGQVGQPPPMRPDQMESAVNSHMKTWERANISRNPLTGEISPEDKQKYAEEEQRFRQQFATPQSGGSSALQMMQSLLQPQDDEE